MAEPKLPAVPAAQNVQVPQFQVPFQPVNSADYLKLQEQLFNQQLGQIRPLTSAMYEMQEDYGPMFAWQRLQMEKQFGPQFAEQLMSQLDIANPEFMPTYSALGERVQQGLEAGYELGPELSTEIQQAIRAAQTARGNWLGGAPTAQEAFGMGSAAISLYNQRLGAAQNFLNSKQPTDMWGALGMASGYQQAPAVYPQVLGSSAAATDVFGQIAASQANYNTVSANAYGTYVNGLVGAAQVNNQSAFDRYSAQFDQFLYRQSVQQGLFSQPSVAGGGGSGFLGAAIGGIGSGLATGIGAAALGAGATGAIGAGVGAAASAAAAAICWVARKVIPDRWLEFRKWLFTQAPAWFRTKYVYSGRRLAEKLSGDHLDRIREIMCQVLSSTERSVA
jgi:hypothetical protein